MMAPNNGSFPLSTELIIHIFCELPLLSDVFALAATCSQFRGVCITYITPIYNEVAPRSIACHQHARRFLAVQGGPALEAPMTWQDVVRMARNADVVAKAVLQFQREIVCKVRTDVDSMRAYCCSGERGHPPVLTRTERPRFISSYYTIWSMMKLDFSEWESRLEHMTLKQLYFLHEMTNLTQSIGREEAIPNWNTTPINCGRSQKRITLGKRAWRQIQDVSERVLNRDALDPQYHAKNKGFRWFVVMWDHYQPRLRDMMVHQWVGAMRLSLDVQKRYLWNEDPEEYSML